jgi:hypothetical protein
LYWVLLFLFALPPTWVTVIASNGLCRPSYAAGAWATWALIALAMTAVAIDFPLVEGSIE